MAFSVPPSRPLRPDLTEAEAAAPGVPLRGIMLAALLGSSVWAGLLAVVLRCLR